MSLDLTFPTQLYPAAKRSAADEFSKLQTQYRGCSRWNHPGSADTPLTAIAASPAPEAKPAIGPFIPETPARRKLIRCHGVDAIDFIQRLFSIDIVPTKQPRWGLLLTPQGRIMAECILILDQSATAKNDILIDCSTAIADELLAKLKLYRLRGKVALEFDTDLQLMIFPASEDPHAFLPPVVNAIVDPRHPLLGWRTYLPQRITAQLQSSLVPANQLIWQQSHFLLGISDQTSFAAGKALPLEYGFDAFNAIDWNKGCYIGQEVTARINYRSQIKRLVVPMLAHPALDNQDELALPVTVFDDADKNCGEIIAVDPPYVLAKLSVAAIRSSNKFSCQHGALLSLQPLDPLHSYLQQQLASITG